MRSSLIAAVSFLVATASSCGLVLGDFDTKGGSTAGTGGSTMSGSGMSASGGGAGGGSSSASTSSSSGVTGCMTDADCNDGNPCHTNTCNAGVCDHGAIPDGPVPGYMDTVKDCKTQKCVSGMQTTVPDDTDVPPSGNPCVTNSCSMSMVVMTDVTSGMSCGTNQICDGMGNCVGCNASSDCAAPGTCKAVVCTAHKCVVSNAQPETTCTGGVCDGNGNCVGCLMNSDCPSGNCTANMCALAVNGHPCSGGNQCQSSHCVNGVCCSDVCTGTCLACTQALTGVMDGKCAHITPGMQAPAGQCTPAPPCGNDGKCSPGGCEQFPSGTTCGMRSCSIDMQTAAGFCDGQGNCNPGSTGACPGGFACANGTACATSCPSDDSVGDASCAMGYWCDGTGCEAQQPPFSQCTRNSQCMNGVCNFNVCN